VHILNKIKGKSVAFVAQGPNIMNMGLGDEIDSHDFVYRTNFFPVKNPEDYGTRCDILSIIPDHIHSIQTTSVQDVITFERVETDKNQYVITPEERLRIRGWFMYQYGLDIFDATAGLVAYWLCKKFKAKIIYYGITGYQDTSGNVVVHSDHWKHYTDWYYDKTGKREFAFSVDLPNYDCHNLWNHNIIFINLLKKGLIGMDQHSLKYFSRE
jgi:hypothetical protein